MSGDRTSDLFPFPRRFDARIQRIYHQWQQGRLREPGLVRDGHNGPELDVLVEIAPGPRPHPLLDPAHSNPRNRVHCITVAVRDLPRLSRDEQILRMEAPRRVRPQLAHSVPEVRADSADLTAAFPGPSPHNGAGVVIGIVDVGCDIAHPNVRTPAGTRILHLWRQTAQLSQAPPANVAYGKAYDQALINAALAANAPYGPTMDSVKPPPKSHGTHVMDIAAGNGRATQHPGVAPQADIIFVDATLGIDPTKAWQDTGSSAHLVDAARYVFEQAEALQQPAVVNVSLAANGGAHDGSSLVDHGFNELLDQPGRAIVVAAGNAYDAKCHTSGTIIPGQPKSLTWSVKPRDETGNELEIWYVGGPLEVFVTPPGLQERGPFNLNSPAVSFDIGGRYYRVYHQAEDSANHVDIFLDPPPTAGVWSIRLANAGAASVSYDAWIERDDETKPDQSFFAADAVTAGTLSTLACGARPIVVGSYGSGQVAQTVSTFSAEGPTRVLGRQKPDISAPGEYDGQQGVLAACALTQGATPYHGTSQAAPHVAGVIALMMQAAPRLLTVDEIRQILMATARPAPGQTLPWDDRAGRGRLDAVAAIKAVLSL